MALHFVTHSILSSEDGIDFGKETQVESQESIKARKQAEEASRKPLFQQLADLAEKKVDVYEENRKRIFAPPSALDEDDVE
jgi:hypothetical protein